MGYWLHQWRKLRKVDFLYHEKKIGTSLFELKQFIKQVLFGNDSNTAINLLNDLFAGGEINPSNNANQSPKTFPVNCDCNLTCPKTVDRLLVVPSLALNPKKKKSSASAIAKRKHHSNQNHQTLKIHLIYNTKKILFNQQHGQSGYWSTVTISRAETIVYVYILRQNNNWLFSSNQIGKLSKFFWIFFF